MYLTGNTATACLWERSCRVRKMHSFSPRPAFAIGLNKARFSRLDALSSLWYEPLNDGKPVSKKERGIAYPRVSRVSIYLYLFFSFSLSIPFFTSTSFWRESADPRSFRTKWARAHAASSKTRLETPQRRSLIYQLWYIARDFLFRLDDQTPTSISSAITAYVEISFSCIAASATRWLSSFSFLYLYHIFSTFVKSFRSENFC